MRVRPVMKAAPEHYLAGQWPVTIGIFGRFLSSRARLLLILSLVFAPNVGVVANPACDCFRHHH
jgi:hypothetical protein